MTEPKDPSDSIVFLHKEIDRLFRDLFPGEADFGRDHFPPLDVIENESALRIEIEIPGLEREDVNIEIAGNLLVVEGIKRDTDCSERMNYICMERRFGCFRRKVMLPAAVDTSGIRATHQNGILTVVVPKLPDRRKMVRKIEID